MKRIIKICTILVLLAIILLPNMSFASSSPSFNIPNYTINATINTDGSIHIEESFMYYFSSSANGLTRDIIYYNKTDHKDDMEPESPRYQARGISNLSVEVSKGNEERKPFREVVAAQAGNNGVYTIDGIYEEGTKGYAVKVYSPIDSYNSQTVYYSYDIEDVVVQYNDMCEIYYNFIGNAIESDIDNFKLNIYFPEGTNLDETKYYPHTYATKLDKIITSVDKENNCISFSINDIPSGMPVDSRIVFQTTNLMDCHKYYNENYDFTSLDNIEQKMTNGNARYFLHINVNILIGIIAILIFITILIYSTAITRKFKFSVKKADYYRDIPNRLNLLQYQLLLPLKVTDPLSSNIIIATILDLVNKKALNMEVKVNKKRWGSNKYDYNLSLNENFDYSTLQPYENQILGLLYSDIVYTSFNAKQYLNKTIELNDRFKEISKSTKMANQIHSGRNRKLIEIKDMYNRFNSPILKILIVCMLILFALVAVNNLIINPSADKLSETFIGLFAIAFSYLLLYAIVLDKLRIVKDEYKEDAKQLYGLHKFLKDYSLIKERYPIEINLWNDYLVFASLFGIADKVSKEFKEELINNGYSDEQIYSTYPILGMSIYSHSFSTTISASSGSGYSGSGSGGGGGGGGGAGAF